jgi:hypothetical protein
LKIARYRRWLRLLVATYRLSSALKEQILKSPELWITSLKPSIPGVGDAGSATPKGNGKYVIGVASIDAGQKKARPRDVYAMPLDAVRSDVEGLVKFEG